MTALSAWFAVGGTITAGVLTETPGVARQPIAGDVPAPGMVSLPDGVHFGPFASTVGPFSACGLFDAASGGSMLYSAALPSIEMPAGTVLTFPRGVFGFDVGVSPDGDVLTINGVPLTIGGMPMQAG